MAEDDKPNYPIESVDRTLRLLSIFRSRSSISLSEVADELAVTRSSAHRLLAMFVWHGYSRQDPYTKEYQAGPKLLELGLGVLRQTAIVGRARPLVRLLADRLGETIHLAVLNGTEVSYIDGIESAKALRAGLRVGTSLPAHATAAGKALLADLSPDHLVALYPEPDLDGVTQHTITNRPELEADLTEIRRRGYAVNDQESEPGLVAVAVSFPDPTGFVQSALAVAVPAVRADTDFIAKLGDLMVHQMHSSTDGTDAMSPQS